MLACARSAHWPLKVQPRKRTDMAIDKNSTGYTFMFSIAMVVVVGTALAFTALSLKDRQDSNAADKKMMDILGAIGVSSDRTNASELFAEYVVERVAISAGGQQISATSAAVNPKDKADPFSIDVKKDYRSSIKSAVKVANGDAEALASALSDKELQFPLFRCVTDSGQNLFVIPVVGSGLWGPIWGYVALEDDMTTIFGANFDHKTETPGLGAEIRESFFTAKFKGKKLNKEGKSLFTILKGGAQDDDYSVDGITGGTITSKGVDEMINRTLQVYLRYFESQTRAQR
ncbi:MAG: NADH:ubiquinone reductase (Na(+)-transporting) subunit C [Flavobacteriales bacterium]|nr:NADH:ubiquinone reductase (Na(+)-transporting) subunit C [Flavobacteriales bacterium]